MIWLNPRRVTIAGEELSHVSVVTVDRKADRVVVEYSDVGPHVAFADVPEQRVTITLVRTLVNEGASGALRPGDKGALTFRTSPSASDAQTREISAEVVITAVEHEVSAKKGAMQTLACVAISPDGASDPISEAVV